MKIKKVNLSDLTVEEKYNLSFPIRPELYYKMREKLPGLPMITVNSENVLLTGIDIFHFLKSENGCMIEALVTDIPYKDALFLGFNIKASITDLNMFEKMVFLKKVHEVAGRSEIYQRTSFDLTISDELVAKIDQVISSDFKNILITNRLGQKAVLKLCGFDPDDRRDMVRLFAEVPFSWSNQMKIIEWVEEIVFRDKISVGYLFGQLELEKILQLPDSQSRIIETIFQTRFPVYTREKRLWEEEVKQLRLPTNMKITHYPYFEKNEIEIKARINNLDSAKLLIREIKKRIDD